MDWLKDNNIYKYHYNNNRIILYSPIARKYILATEKHLSDFLEFGLYYDTINSEFYMYYKVELEKIRKEIFESIVEFKTKKNEINQVLHVFMEF